MPNATEETTIETANPSTEQTANAGRESRAGDYNSVLDAALDRIVGGGTNAGADAKAGTEDAENASEPAIADAGATANPTRDAETERQIAVLKRDGVPPDVIETLAKSDPAKLRGWAESASKRQSAVDGYGNRIKELEAKVGEKSPKDAKGDEGKQAKSDGAASADDAEKLEDEAFEQLADSLGEEPARALRKGLTAKATALSAAVKAAQEDAKAARLEQSAQLAATVVLGERGGSVKQLPAVLSRMSELGSQSPGTFATVEALAQAAADSLGLKPAESTADGTTGQAADMGNSAQRRPMTRDQRENAVLNTIVRGGSREQAARAGGFSLE